MGQNERGRNMGSPAQETRRSAPQPGPGRRGARLVPGKGLWIEDLLIEDSEVAQEATRWASGRRGDPAGPDVTASADLAPFVRTAVAVGARVLASTADSSSVTALSGTVAQLAERAETAGQAMITDAQRAASATVELTVAATKAATEETGKIIEGASKTVSVEMARSVKGGVEAVERELERLLGGERAPVIESIKGIVSKAMADAQVAWQSTLTTTLSEVAKTLDVSNESSPLRALERRLFEQQRISHNEIAGRLERVQEMVGTTIGAAQTAAAVAVIEAHSPGKGLPFEAAIGAAAEVVAAGMGATYTATANSVGALKGSKKGDGVFEVSPAECGDRCARVVIECTTGGARNWADYLDQAERNRQAQASLGVVARRDLVPGGEMLAVLAPNRIVMAYDPASDEPALFRSALLLLLVQAQRQLTDGRTGDLGAVDTKLAEAKRSLLVMQELMKTAMSVRTGASKVVTGLESLHATLTLCLEQAQGALRNSSRQAA